MVAQNMQDAQKCKNGNMRKKIAMLQQVQYKVLQYGLYAPIET
jgi:hypothetical protein